MNAPKSRIDFNFTEDADPKIADMILEGLQASLSSKSEISELTIAAKDSKQNIVGGLTGKTHRQLLQIQHLWTEASPDSKRVAAELLEKAEHEAKTRGCLASYLSTFSQDAAQFYKSHGYQVLGESKNQHRHFFKKHLF